MRPRPRPRARPGRDGAPSTARRRANRAQPRGRSKPTGLGLLARHTQASCSTVNEEHAFVDDARTIRTSFAAWRSARRAASGYFARGLLGRERNARCTRARRGNAKWRPRLEKMTRPTSENESARALGRRTTNRRRGAIDSSRLVRGSHRRAMTTIRMPIFPARTREFRTTNVRAIARCIRSLRTNLETPFASRVSRFDPNR